MSSYGLRQSQIEKIIMKEFDKNPDLKYYIEDENIWLAFELMISGISKAIEQNTKEIYKYIGY
ncbi:hypothetical protein KPL28_09590 [Clostridium algidicarnis]|uniref:hypothetical protein n=1 Tax=Clostridium algidicarnis TaxID=37659 RepID=UPI001C0E2052|nr:hypothetical protein [Clostridium algidicarnis]MBU3209872.1 hypothetical protein [Clostridium algidicarnis]